MLVKFEMPIGNPIRQLEKLSGDIGAGYKNLEHHHQIAGI